VSVAVAIASLAITACAPPRATPEREQVLFVCEHGAAKSVLAAAYFNSIAAARGLPVRATARGADPQEAPSRATVDGLHRDGLAPVVERPLPLKAQDVRRSARVVAFDCDAPAMKALRSLDTCWNDVPAVSDDYEKAREAIRTHVAALVDEQTKAQER
jgi:protein-tyrosine-phosphatase